MSFPGTPQDRNRTFPSTGASPTRRAFFPWMIGLAASVIGLGMAAPLASYVVTGTVSHMGAAGAFHLRPVLVALSRPQY